MNITTSTPETVTITTTAKGVVITQTGAGEMQIAADRNDVLGTRRLGNDAVIIMTDGKEIVLKDYFAAAEPVTLLFADSDGWLWQFEKVEGSDFFLFRTDPLAAAGQEDGLSGGLLAALGGGAALLAMAGGGGGGGGNDAGSNPVAPARPSGVTISPAGDRVTGTGQNGSIVEIRDGNGKVIAKGPVKDGKFDITLKPAKTDGEKLEVVQVQDGLESPSTNITAPTIIEKGVVAEVSV